MTENIRSFEDFIKKKNDISVEAYYLLIILATIENVTQELNDCLTFAKNLEKAGIYLFDTKNAVSFRDSHLLNDEALFTLHYLCDRHGKNLLGIAKWIERLVGKPTEAQRDNAITNAESVRREYKSSHETLIQKNYSLAFTSIDALLNPEE